MASGQAAFDFVFTQMVPGGVKKDAKPSEEEEPGESSKQLSLKWRPAPSELVADQERSPQAAEEQPSCSFQQLMSLDLEISSPQVGQVQLALENGQVLALEDKKDDTVKGDEVTKKRKPGTIEEGNGKGLKEKKVKTDKKEKADNEKVPFKKDDERKTFANRTCPPGIDGSTRFKAIQTAYNKVIKPKISKNQEVGFRKLFLILIFCFQTWQAAFWTYCRKYWEGKDLELSEYEKSAWKAAEVWLKNDGQKWLFTFLK